MMARPSTINGAQADDAWQAAGTVDLPAPSRGRMLLLAIIVMLVGFFVFYGALNNEFVDWDDTGVLVDNPNWRGFGVDQLKWMFTQNHYGHYQPVTWLTYALDFEIWGMNPRGYHLTNNLFHAMNTGLVFLVSLALLRRGFAGDYKRFGDLLPYGAALSALLFAVHPLRVESVAWATERRDLVSAFFILLTVWTYLRAMAPGETQRTRWLAISLVIYVISMLSKVGGAPLPIVLLVLDWYPLRRIPFDPRRWLRGASAQVLLEKIPFFVIAIGFAVSTVIQQKDQWLIPFELHGFDARVGQSFYALIFYTLKTLAPVNLLPLYELHMPLDPTAGLFAGSAVLVLVVGMITVIWRRKCPGLMAAILVYGAMLGPLLGFFQNGPQLVADRYSYLSTLGLVLLGVAGLLVLSRPASGARREGRLLPLALIPVIALSVLTWQQVEVWRNSRALWGHIVEADPGSSYANNSYGYLILETGDAAKALPYFERAIDINVRNGRAHLNLWDAAKQIRLSRDDYDNYIGPYLVKATESDAAEIVAEARYQLGNIALRRKEHQEAASLFEQSLKLRPESDRTWVNLGVALLSLGQLDEAVVALQKAIVINPDLLNAHSTLGAVLYRQNKKPEALAAYRRVLEIKPDHATAQRMVTELSGG